MAEQGLQHMEQIATLFDGIKDEASAKAALPQLEKLIDQLAALKAQADKMPRPSAEQENALNDKFAARGEAAGMKTRQAIAKHEGDEKIGAVLKPLMEKFRSFK